jgi:hypothetical protein
VIFAILLIPSLLASWFCYWFSSVFPSLANRTSRIICIACPFVLAILLAVIFSISLGESGADFSIPDHPKRVIPALLVAIATVLVIPTLLLAFAATKLRRDSENRKKRQA